MLEHTLQQNILSKLNTAFQLRAKKLLIAYSGGVDSSVLLHLLANINKNHHALNLSAIHINHNLSPNAKLWQTHCMQNGSRLGISCDCVSVTISRAGGESLENNARLARYKAFAATNAEVIILAHHKNDQVETIFSQFLRGSDIHNLAAMQEFSWYKHKLLWRPLLGIDKQAILAYAKEHNLNYIEDESNLDSQYLRNFIRNELLPLIKNRDPHIDQKILTTGQNIARTLSLVDEITIEDLNNCLESPDIINLTKLKQLSSNRQNSMLNLFIKQHGFKLPSQKHLNEFIRQSTTSNNPLQLDLKPGYLFKQKTQLKLCYPTSIGSTSK